MATSGITERALYRVLTRAVANEIRLAATASPFAQLLTQADANHAVIVARRDAAAAAARAPWTQLGVELGTLVHDQVKAHPTLTLQAIFHTPAVQAAVHMGVSAAQKACRDAILDGWRTGVAAGIQMGQSQLSILGQPLGDPHPPAPTKYVTALLSDVDRNARRVQARLMVGANTKAGLGGIKLTAVTPETLALTPTQNPNVVPAQTQSAQAQQQAAITAQAVAAVAAARAAVVTPEQQMAQDAYDQANVSSDQEDSDVQEAAGIYDDGSTGGTFDADPDTASGLYDADAEGDSGVYDDNSLTGTGAGNDGLAQSALNFVQQIMGMGGSPAGVGGAMGSVRGASDGATAAYEASSSSVQMVWVTNFIESTCADCAGMNGQIVGTSDSFDGSASFADVASDTYTDLDGPPRHPWCGCSVVPFIDDMSTLGLDPNALTPGPPGPTPVQMREFAQHWAAVHPNMHPRTLPGHPLSEITEHTKLIHSDDVKLFPQAKFDEAVETFKACAIPAMATPVEQIVEHETAHEVVEAPEVAADLVSAADQAASAVTQEAAQSTADIPAVVESLTSDAVAALPQAKYANAVELFTACAIPGMEKK